MTEQLFWWWINSLSHFQAVIMKKKVTFDLFQQIKGEYFLLFVISSKWTSLAAGQTSDAEEIDLWDFNNNENNL